MKIYLRILFLASISTILCQEKVSVDTDYAPLNSAYDSVRKIQIKYDNYKTIINKKSVKIFFIFHFSVTIEYEKCKEMVKTMHCSNIDQWQSVIEELKQENSNSENSEIPFLIQRKRMKVEKFAKVLNQTQLEGDTFENLTSSLTSNQQKILDAFYLIENIYKLPKEEPDFVQLSDDNTTEEATSNNQTASQILNADVPDLAKEQLNIAKKAYDIADQSIQAQTASNILKTFNHKMIETLSHVNDSYTARQAALQTRKEQLQGDILKTRVMVQNEMTKQAKNNEKIASIQGQIDQCSGMPTDELKDCNPIKVNASKLLTEIQIIQTRTDLLNKHLGDAVEENLSEEQVQQHLENVANAKGENEKQAQIDLYLKDPEIHYVQHKKPNELHPIHHLKDNLPEEKEKEEPKEEASQNETTQEGETNEQQP